MDKKKLNQKKKDEENERFDAPKLIAYSNTVINNDIINQNHYIYSFVDGIISKFAITFKDKMKRRTYSVFGNNVFMLMEKTIPGANLQLSFKVCNFITNGLVNKSCIKCDDEQCVSYTINRNDGNIYIITSDKCIKCNPFQNRTCRIPRINFGTEILSIKFPSIIMFNRYLYVFSFAILSFSPQLLECQIFKLDILDEECGWDLIGSFCFTYFERVYSFKFGNFPSHFFYGFYEFKSFAHLIAIESKGNIIIQPLENTGGTSSIVNGIIYHHCDFPQSYSFYGRDLKTQQFTHINMRRMTTKDKSHNTYWKPIRRIHRTPQNAIQKKLKKS